MIQKIRAQLDYILTDTVKFDSGTNVYGTRVRKGLQEIKVQIKEIRDAITEVKAIRKSKK